MIRRYLHWLFVHPLIRCVWIALLGIPAAFLFAHIAALTLGVTSDWPRRFRIAASALQFAGVLMVIWRLWLTGLLFNHHLKRLAISWLAARPSRRAIASGAIGNVTIGPLRARAHGTSRLGPEATVEQRLALVEDRVENLGKAVYTLDGKLDEHRDEVKAALEVERTARNAADDETRRLIERAQADFLPWDIVGAFWILSGLAVAILAERL